MSKYQFMIENKELFQNLVHEGKSKKEIANILKVSIPTVSKYGAQFGLYTQEVKKQEKIISGDFFEKSNLIILERDFDPPFKSHETAYKCKCSICGEEKTYRLSNIKNGPGCHRCSGVKGGRGYKEWEVGDKFGYLVIVGPAQNNDSRYVSCFCTNCNKTIKDIRISHLKGHHHSRTISCGCKQSSSGELKIMEILDEGNIEYKTQYQISDFSQFSLFDFALFKNNKLIGLLEYDGKQHFEPIEHFGGKEQFLIQQERDKNKNEYCLQQGIKLVRIPYYNFDKINLEYLLQLFPELS